MIWDMKKEHWINWLERADDQSIWTIHQFISAPPGDGAKTCIPTLKVKCTDGMQIDAKENKDKAKVLYDSFFFAPPQDNYIDLDYPYPPPCATFENITDQQIHQTIKCLKLCKGMGPDRHSNSLYKHCHKFLILHLSPYYRATFNLKHYPTKWK